ncbi:MAG: RHS repeat-associated core domain-containing protein [Bergeyella cardium]
MTETTIKKYIPFGEPISPDTAQGGFGFIPNGIREKNIFFYHPDHLGSSSYITGNDGKVSQHTEYIAFGEILFDEHSSEHTMPYLFNGKELDQETNLTYFGARYLDMKTSLWLNTDPLSGYNPTFEHEHYIDGQHNGGVFNPMNLNTYGYTYQNPIVWIDPNGKQVWFSSMLRFMPLAENAAIRPEVIGENTIRATETTSKIGEISSNSSRFAKQQEIFNRGRQIEAEQIKRMNNEGQNIIKNTKNEKGIDPKTGRETIVRPDGKTPEGRFVEVKNVKKQSLTRQLRTEDNLSQGGRLILRINKDAHLSKPLKNSGIEIQYYGIGSIKMDGGIKAQNEKRKEVIKFNE